MTRKESKDLKIGIYKLYWKSGGFSIAAVGQLYDGVKWYAPLNWTCHTASGIASDKWNKIKYVEFIGNHSML